MDEKSTALLRPVGNDIRGKMLAETLTVRYFIGYMACKATLGLNSTVRDDGWRAHPISRSSLSCFIFLLFVFSLAFFFLNIIYVLFHALAGSSSVIGARLAGTHARHGGPGVTIFPFFPAPEDTLLGSFSPPVRSIRSVLLLGLGLGMCTLFLVCLRLYWQ